MRYKILTVDDSRTIRMIVKNAFKNYDCELFEAENGRDGLALAAEVSPDLIILDITMPVMTGIEMLGKMMADERLKDISVIMLTAEGGRDNVMSIVKMGVKDYIVKPFKGDQLVERVKMILEDLNKRIDAPVGNNDAEGDGLFAVDSDIVVLTLPEKITRIKASEIEQMVKTKIDHMTAAGANRFVLNLSQVAKLNMTAIQTVLALVNACLKAKLLIRLAATRSQAESLKGFKETNSIPTSLSVEAAKMDF